MGEAGDVDLQHVELPIERQLYESALGAEAGVVDQDVHFEAHALQVGEEMGWGFRVGEVGGEDLGLNLVGFSQLGGQCFEGITFAGYQGEAAAVRREAAGQFKPNARGCSGD